MLLKELMQLNTLSQEEQMALEKDNITWDQQMLADAQSGKFDELAAQAIAEYKAGKTTSI